MPDRQRDGRADRHDEPNSHYVMKKNATKAYRKNGGTAPLIFNIATSRSSVVYTTPRPLAPGKEQRYSLDGD
jgi:hypothetical protein